jgi:7-carboxy-7-deazaguanine synthase
VLKIVVFGEADYAYARGVWERHSDLPVVLQVGNEHPPTAAGEGALDEEALKARFRWLVERVATDRWYSARVLPQLHLWAWGNARGV